MKRITVLIAALFALTSPMASFAAMDHGDHGSMDMGHGGHQGDVAYAEVVDGVKAAFKIISMKEMPAGMKETHHLMVVFTDAKSGKNLSEGDVKVKIQGPDKTEQTKDLMGMPGMSGMGAGFGADVVMVKKGKYGVMCKFQLKDGKVRSAKFWYTVK